MNYDGHLPGEDEVTTTTTTTATTTTTTTTAAAATATTATTATAKATTQLDITLVSPIMSLCVTRLLKCYSADLQMRHQKLFTLARHLSVGHFSK